MLLALFACGTEEPRPVASSGDDTAGDTAADGDDTGTIGDTAIAEEGFAAWGRLDGVDFAIACRAADGWDDVYIGEAPVGYDLVLECADDVNATRVQYMGDNAPGAYDAADDSAWQVVRVYVGTTDEPRLLGPDDAHRSSMRITTETFEEWERWTGSFEARWSDGGEHSGFVEGEFDVVFD
ncbi:MAG: hypothetical protein ACOZNI_33580 [Myxococcota bacterium]